MSFRGWPKQELRIAGERTVEAIFPVILSASRATDLPAFYAEWFRNRLEAGYLQWVNPFNAHQIQYVALRDVRVVVFWSKNPEPLLPHLDALDERGIHYYFQFTVNDYESEGLEPRLPPVSQRIQTFRSLAERVGRERVIWRFDPLLLTRDLSAEILLERIQRIGEELQGHTSKLIFSFADIAEYRTVRERLARAEVGWVDFTRERMVDFAGRLSKIGRALGLPLATCAESIDLTALGIEANRCIDDELMIRLWSRDTALMRFLGYEPNLFGETNRPVLKDKGQRKACGCIVSKDIGRYRTCAHLCRYCYANGSAKEAIRNHERHNPRAESIL